MDDPAIAMGGPHPGMRWSPPSGKENPLEDESGSSTSAQRTFNQKATIVPPRTTDATSAFVFAFTAARYWACSPASAQACFPHIPQGAVAVDCVITAIAWFPKNW